MFLHKFAPRDQCQGNRYELQLKASIHDCRAVWNASADTTQSTMDVVNKAAHALMGDPKKPADRQLSFRREKRAVAPAVWCFYICCCITRKPGSDNISVTVRCLSFSSARPAKERAMLLCSRLAVITTATNRFHQTTECRQSAAAGPQE
jgi:hypothetical protein